MSQLADELAPSPRLKTHVEAVTFGLHLGAVAVGDGGANQSPVPVEKLGSGRVTALLDETREAP